MLEWRFGPLRFVLVLVLTIVGGNMFSSLLEEECFFYAGASSGVYGVIGMQFGDALYNWHRTEAPLARVLITLVMVAQMAYQIAALDHSVSGMAHLGSFLLGLCGGVTVMMTHIPPTGWQKAAGAVAVLVNCPQGVRARARTRGASPAMTRSRRCSSGSEAGVRRACRRPWLAGGPALPAGRRGPWPWPRAKPPGRQPAARTAGPPFSYIL